MPAAHLHHKVVNPHVPQPWSLPRLSPTLKIPSVFSSELWKAESTHESTRKQSLLRYLNQLYSPVNHMEGDSHALGSVHVFSDDIDVFSVRDGGMGGRQVCVVSQSPFLLKESK